MLMYVSSSKRTPIPKKGSGLQLRDGDMTPRFCNRIGCHGRLNHNNVPTNAHTSKYVHASSRKTIVRSSMETCSRRLASSSQRKPDMPEVCSAETIQAQSNNSSSRKIRMGEVVGSSSGRPHKVSRQRSGQINQEISLGLSASLAFKSSLSSRQTMDNNTRMHSLRNASKSNTNLTRNKVIGKRQNPSAIETKIPLRSKRVSRPTTEGGRGSVRVPSNGISISDSRHQPLSRASTIPSRIPVPRSSSRSRPLLGESSSRTDRSSSSIRREVPWAVGNSGQDEGISQQRLNRERRNFQGAHDQYRDMRLDIDNMSYEELLALGERIGNVSTGICEEEKSKYIWKMFYHCTSCPYSSSLETILHDHDIQCSICQEEYMTGDEGGILNCNHSYHFACISEWLKINKWCPICKVEAAPIGSSSSSM